MRIATYVMIAAFVLSAIVQINDLDPLPWMTVYGVAAIASYLFLREKYYWILFALIGVITLALALQLLPDISGRVAVSELFEQWEMKDERVEIARETGGLLIVAVWMAVLTIVSLRRRKKA